MNEIQLTLNLKSIEDEKSGNRFEAPKKKSKLFPKFFFRFLEKVVLQTSVKFGMVGPKRFDRTSKLFVGPEISSTKFLLVGVAAELFSPWLRSFRCFPFFFRETFSFDRVDFVRLFISLRFSNFSNFLNVARRQRRRHAHRCSPSRHAHAAFLVVRALERQVPMVF